MSLVEHLRELRNRLAWSFLAIGIGTVIGWIFYPQLFEILYRPFKDAALGLDKQDSQTILAITGIADAFNLKLEISAAAGLILASPVWLYQTFRFITPGLHRREKQWAGLFVGAALPLFLAGATAAYFTLPRVLKAFLGFTPDGVSNIISLDKYMSFFIQLMIAFGVGCIAPAVIVVLNTAGILSARRFASWWRWVLLFTLVFAAIATPTGDPVNMALFATPLLLLMLIAFAICWNTDRRRAKRARNQPYGEGGNLDDLDDDETSPLVLHRDPADEAASRIDELP
jgi:sec-independent protein translocase protein TatC